MASESVDSDTTCFYLEVDDSQIVLLQGTFEAYEGLAAVRTIGKERPVVTLIATNDMAPTVRELLNSMREDFGGEEGVGAIRWKESAVVPKDPFFNDSN